VHFKSVEEALQELAYTAISGSSSGHTIQEDGIGLTARTNLNFVGDGFEVWDDAGNDATIVSGTASSDDIGTDDVTIKQLGSPTWTTQTHFNNLFGCVGRATGGIITDAGSGTVNITAGTGFIKATDDDTAELMSFDWSESLGIEIPNGGIGFIGVKYNAGSPEVDSREDQDWDYDTEFPLGSVINLNEVLYILNNPWWVTDGITNLIEKSIALGGYLVRDNFVGGLMLGVTGTRNPTMTAGTVWGRLNEFEMDAIDYSVTGTFHSYWFESDGTIHETTGTSQYSITQWNDIDNDQLDTIGNNQYAVWWVFLNVTNNELAFMYPYATYSNAASAEAEELPSHYPGDWYLEGLIIGRIIIQQGEDAPVEVQSAFTTQFTPAQAADHGNLAGLADDDHVQYLLADGTRALAGAWDMGDQALTNVNIDSSTIDIVDAGDYYAATTVEGALQEVGAAVMVGNFVALATMEWMQL